LVANIVILPLRGKTRPEGLCHDVLGDERFRKLGVTLE
jgi:hypothetical protein